MPIYRLEPIEGLQEHNAWRASHVGPMAVWVRARDCDDARQKMQLATITTVEGFEPKLELEIVYGGDGFYIDPDQEHGRVNVRGIAR